MTADLIIYAIVAAVLVFWLKSILGTRNGEERDRENPFAPKGDITPVARANDNIIDLPHRGSTSLPAIRVTKTTLVNRVKIETPDAEKGLRLIADKDSSFNLDRFLESAESAFELIVTAFASGDRATLKGLLTPSVYNDFDHALTDRLTRGETVETQIESIPAMDVVAASLAGNMAFISVRFTAQETCLIRNAAGTVVSGEPDRTTTMIDIWTFGRNITDTSPIWYLHETRDETTEQHKTPLPESTKTP